MDGLTQNGESPLLIAAVIKQASSLRLTRHSDGSWEVDRDGRSLGHWDADNQQACFSRFMTHANLHVGSDVTLWVNIGEFEQTSLNFELNSRPAMNNRHVLHR